MEFKIRAIETKVVAIENELAIIWDNMRKEFAESTKQKKEILNLLKNIENKLNYALAERTNHGANEDQNLYKYGLFMHN